MIGRKKIKQKATYYLSGFLNFKIKTKQFAKPSFLLLLLQEEYLHF